MIALTRLDGTQVTVNADHILLVEQAPDTIVTLTTGLHLIVREPVAGVVERVVAYRRCLLAGPPTAAAAEG